MNNEQKYLEDNHGRKHDYLRISLTDKCNLRCFYCMPEEGIELRERSSFMTAEELIEIAKVFISQGIKKIRLTGGEPLVKKNAKLVINELGKLPIELSLTTNAILVDQYILDLKKAGVKSVNVSLDTLKEERFNTITKRDYFKKVMSNIQLLIQENFKVKINVVLIKNVNDDEIVDFVNWSKNKPIELRFIEFMPFDGNQWNWDKKVSYKEILNTIKKELGDKSFKKIEDHPNDTAKNFQLKNATGSFGIISSVTNPFCDTCNRIRLTADGKIKNCLFSNKEIDLLTAHRKNLPLIPLIKESIYNKKKQHAGIKSFEKTNPNELKNRSMISIGG
ncbi:GTP 3',8-cyclase MoaA [Flavobacteriales bacterium]|nr:GTP 3',8-cyclase MoaA [Flavobacteriales bacterium]